MTAVVKITLALLGIKGVRTILQLGEVFNLHTRYRKNTGVDIRSVSITAVSSVENVVQGPRLGAD